MISLWLIIGIFLLLSIGIIAYALRSKTIILALSAIVIISSLTLYYYMGNPQGVHNAFVFQQFNMAAENGEESTQMLPELISGLESQLKHHPNDPITFALLGKIYFTLKDYQAASHAFAKAYQLMPDDSELLIDYVTAYFLAQDGVTNAQMDILLEKVAHINPTLDSLSLLANVALAKGDTQLAIDYWQQMQIMLNKDDPLYQELNLTIDWAKHQ